MFNVSQIQFQLFYMYTGKKWPNFETVYLEIIWIDFDDILFVTQMLV